MIIIVWVYMCVHIHEHVGEAGHTSGGQGQLSGTNSLFPPLILGIGLRLLGWNISLAM